MIGQEAINKYLSRRQVDFERCLLGFTQRNYADIEMIGHNMKGNGSTFGFPELSELGESLEIGARQKDDQLIKAKLDEFKIWLTLKSALPY
jgi:hypothetical protein